MIVIGAVLCLLTMAQFVLDGGGTPELYAQPTMLISRGAFRWTRNPLYLGMTVTLLGEAVFAQSPSLIVYASYWIREFVQRVKREEATMLRRFGETYLRYAETTPRWLPGLSGSAAALERSHSPDEHGRRLIRAKHRRESASDQRMLRKSVLRVGQILALFAFAGYMNSLVPIFSQAATPFLWFDPAENHFHLGLRLMMLIVAGLRRFWLASVSAYRTILTVAGVALIAAALAGFFFARRPAPNILGITNFENPVENVIHWVVGVQCLFAAARQYLTSSVEPRKAQCPA